MPQAAILSLAMGWIFITPLPQVARLLLFLLLLAGLLLITLSLQVADQVVVKFRVEQIVLVEVAQVVIVTLLILRHLAVEHQVKLL
tara:strand:- start:830 stop:1087 length:258 start_codon:yes stop_codon:yes gene_type:complete